MADGCADELLAALRAQSQEARDIYIGEGVPRIPGPPPPLQFLRRYVAMNRPVIFTRCVDKWPALSKWSHSYLRSVVGDANVHVALTPDGLADAVVRHPTTGERVFAKPHEALIPFSEFLDAVESPLCDGSGARRRLVHYCSHQNSSLTAEFKPLWSDVELSLPWADKAFGAPPDAVNLWVGEEGARTTAHSDLYENLYVVVAGSKRFTLLPPHDAHALGYASFPDATWRPAHDRTGDHHESAPRPYQPDMGLELSVDEPATHTRWVPIDLEAADALPHGPPKLEVTLRAGELLYIPSHWVHAVSQSVASGDAGRASDCTTIAVNFWYSGEAEASLGPGFVQRNLLERLSELIATPGPSPGHAAGGPAPAAARDPAKDECSDPGEAKELLAASMALGFAAGLLLASLWRFR